jgi:hypothetical protein
MEKTKSIILLFILLLFTGCATKGRFSVVDLDLRNPEQIKESIIENTVIYNNTTNNVPVISQPKMPEDIWDIIVRIVSVMKGRLRILSFEWNERNEK